MWRSCLEPQVRGPQLPDWELQSCTHRRCIFCYFLITKGEKEAERISYGSIHTSLVSLSRTTATILVSPLLLFLAYWLLHFSHICVLHHGDANNRSGNGRLGIASRDQRNHSKQSSSSSSSSLRSCATQNSLTDNTPASRARKRERERVAYWGQCNQRKRAKELALKQRSIEGNSNHTLQSQVNEGIKRFFRSNSSSVSMASQGQYLSFFFSKSIKQSIGQTYCLVRLYWWWFGSPKALFLKQSTRSSRPSPEFPEIGNTGTSSFFLFT